jgi:Transposase and inactivated derivatives
MIGGTVQTRIFLCTEDTDMRKSFNSLRGVIQRAMHLDPLSGYIFVFKNKRADRIKCMYWEGDGFAMWYKVLQKGTFQFPDLRNFSSAGVEIDSATLHLILDGVDLSSIRRRQRYRISAQETEERMKAVVF